MQKVRWYRRLKWGLINDQWVYVIGLSFFFGSAGVDGGPLFMIEVTAVSFVILYLIAMLSVSFD